MDRLHLIIGGVILVSIIMGIVLFSQRGSTSSEKNIPILSEDIIRTACPEGFPGSPSFISCEEAVKTAFNKVPFTDVRATYLTAWTDGSPVYRFTVVENNYYLCITVTARDSPKVIDVSSGKCPKG